MKLAGKTVLVIGGAGFIGSHTVEELLARDVKKVLVYDNFTRGKATNISKALRDQRCEVYAAGGDIRDSEVLQEAMTGVDAVIHLAALWLLHCEEYPRAAFNVNIGGFFEVLEAARLTNIQRLIFASSASVYGDAQFTPMDESHPYNNKNLYGATKIAGEHLARAYQHRYSLDFLGLRYMNVYGPRQDQHGAYTGVIPTLLNRIDDQQPLEVHGDGLQSYDFVYVEDVARANVLALESEATDEFVNVGTGVKTSVKDVVELTLRLTQSELPVHYVSQDSEDSRRLVTERVGDPALAASLIGFTSRINLAEGIQNLISWRNGDKK